VRRRLFCIRRPVLPAIVVLYTIKTNRLCPMRRACSLIAVFCLCHSASGEAHSVSPTVCKLCCFILTSCYSVSPYSFYLCVYFFDGGCTWCCFLSVLPAVCICLVVLCYLCSVFSAIFVSRDGGRGRYASRRGGCSWRHGSHSHFLHVSHICAFSCSPCSVLFALTSGLYFSTSARLK